jgi:ABC-type Na+ efflux pump permease subunit
MAKTRAKRKNAGGDVEAPVVAVAPVVVAPVEAPVPVQAPLVAAPTQAPVQVVEAPVEVKEPVQERAVESVYDKLEDLKKSVHIDTANFKTKERVQQVEEDDVEEVESEEEFDKHSDTTPKKMSTGLILMGVGAFFLTWGAVNFFKSRR